MKVHNPQDVVALRCWCSVCQCMRRRGLKQLHPTSRAKLWGCPTQPGWGRAVSPVDSRVMVVSASQRRRQAMARTTMVLIDRPRTQAAMLSQLPRDVAQRVAMVVARALTRLMGSRPPTLAMGPASSQQNLGKLRQQFSEQQLWAAPGWGCGPQQCTTARL